MMDRLAMVVLVVLTASSAACIDDGRQNDPPPDGGAEIDTTSEMQPDTGAFDDADTGSLDDAGDTSADDTGTITDTATTDTAEPDDGGDAGDVPESEFVTIDPDEPRFLLNGEPFYFAGTNLYWMVQQFIYDNKAVVDDALDACEAVGIRVIRIWGFADGDDWTQPDDGSIMQPEPGTYNESAFEALDYVLAEAEKHDVKVIIPFVNYWEAYGGMEQYARWTGGSGYEHFYTDMAARQLYMDYIEHMVTRENTITGEEYRNDPTIMAWELANEAQAGFDENAERDILEGWYAEMAAYVRSLDTNHMVATGEEGFAVPEYSDRYADNYSNTYVLRGTVGTSYVDNTALAEISYGGAHLYPDAWGLSEPIEDGRRWITDHVEIAHEQGKPFVLGEFGYQDRSVYEEWLSVIEEQDVAGALLWQLVPASRGRHNDGMAVMYPDDSELVDLFTQHAEYMNAKGSQNP